MLDIIISKIVSLLKILSMDVKCLILKDVISLLAYINEADVKLTNFRKILVSAANFKEIIAILQDSTFQNFIVNCKF